MFADFKTTYGSTQAAVTCLLENSVEAKIKSFAHLKRDGFWRGRSNTARNHQPCIGDGFIPNNQFGIWDIDVFPGAGGEISIVSSYNEYDIEAIVEADHTISVAHDHQKEQVAYKPNLVMERAKREINAIVGKAWTVSEYFTHATTILSEIGGTASHSAIWATASLSSTYDCLNDHSSNITTHIQRYYDNLSTNPPTFWRFDSDILPLLTG